ncbi:hypothetical protein Dimus_001434, partial [Dionaea muscipula]
LANGDLAAALKQLSPSVIHVLFKSDLDSSERLIPDVCSSSFQSWWRTAHVD